MNAMNPEAESYTINRRFPSLLTAIETMEAEGKLDLSYNRPLALSNAKYTDRRSSPTVLEIEGAIHLIVRAPDGMDCLTEYSPFSSCMHDGQLAVLFPVDATDKRCELAEATTLKRLVWMKNTDLNRKAIANFKMIAGC